MVQENGEGVLGTVSTFSEEAPENVIGSFVVKLSPTSLETLKTLARATETTIKGDRVFVPEAEVFEYKSGDKITRKWQRDEGKVSSQWVAFYEAIRKEASKHPLAALHLRCDPETTGFRCFYKNVGTEKVATVDPLSIPRSLSCLPQTGVPKFLSGQRETAPKNGYQKWEILPQASHAFTITTKDKCTTRLRVDTSTARFNPDYKGVLAGELISGELH